MKIIVKSLVWVLLSVLTSCAGVQSRYYVTTGQETLQNLALRFSLTETNLLEHNEGLVRHKKLAAGQKIYIPFEEQKNWNAHIYRVKNSSTGDENTFAMRSPASLEQVRLDWPVMGIISSFYGPRDGRNHNGVDIAARKGTAVSAARGGHVIYAGQKISGYGKMVIIKHPDLITTVYAHLSSITVKKGRYVSRGKLIGRVGSTGHSTGPHLHFEVRDNRLPVNPLLYLQRQVATNTVLSK